MYDYLLAFAVWFEKSLSNKADVCLFINFKFFAILLNDCPRFT